MCRGFPFPALALIAVAAVGLLLVFTTSVSAADVTIGWDPNSEADLLGYGIYYRKNPPNPPNLLFSQ